MELSVLKPVKVCVGHPSPGSYLYFCMGLQIAGGAEKLVFHPLTILPQLKDFLLHIGMLMYNSNEERGMYERKIYDLGYQNVCLKL